jgi:hypothetical protein
VQRISPARPISAVDSGPAADFGYWKILVVNSRHAGQRPAM